MAVGSRNISAFWRRIPGHRIALAPMLLLLLLASDVPLGSSTATSDRPEMWQEAALRFVAILEENRTREAAEVMAFPSSVKGELLQKEREGVARALAYALRKFGQPRAAAIASEPVAFYEFAVGGGPRPYWWRELAFRSEDAAVLVRFDHFGPGVIRISLMEVEGQPTVVAVGFGLRTERVRAREDIADILRAYFDESGVPVDHPARVIDLKRTEVPAPKP